MTESKHTAQLRPVALRSEGSDRYRVRFSRDGEEIEYVFAIENASGSSELGVLTWEDSFFKDIGGDLSSVSNLFKAILSFHLAAQAN